MKFRKAQALIEFALVIPLAVFILAVFVDLGRAVYAYASLSNAVREGARFAVVHQSQTSAEQDAVIAQVRAQLHGIDLSKVTITVTPPTADSGTITVHAAYEFNAITPGLKMVIAGGDNLVLQAESTMRVSPIVIPED